MRYLFSILLYLNLCLLNLNIPLNNNAFADSNIPTDVKIPPAIELSNNLWLASVHQFVLVPLTGQVAVYYTGVFNQTDSSSMSKNFVIPFPKGVQASPIISVDVKPGVQQIQETIFLDAPFGKLDWTAGQIGILPGVTVILLKSSSAKITMQSADFIHDPSQDLNADQYVRVSWNPDTPYPQFKLNYLIPSRIFIYILLIIIAVLLFSVLFIFVRMKR